MRFFRANSRKKITNTSGCTSKLSLCECRFDDTGDYSLDLYHLGRVRTQVAVSVDQENSKETRVSMDIHIFFDKSHFLLDDKIRLFIYSATNVCMYITYWIQSMEFVSKRFYRWKRRVTDNRRNCTEIVLSLRKNASEWGFFPSEF